jgi:hypothetical protein
MIDSLDGAMEDSQPLPILLDLHLWDGSAGARMNF